MEVTLELAARMLILGGKAETSGQGRQLCVEALKSGKPRELFLANIKSQGGDPDKFLAMLGTYRSPCRAQICAGEDAYVSRIDAWKAGHAGVILGVGRDRTEDAVSPTAGIQFHKQAGDRVKKGNPVMTVWAKDQNSLEAAVPGLMEAVEYSQNPPPARKLILKEMRQG
jgi:pyrimidine-nucleoside phosphorylase